MKLWPSVFIVPKDSPHCYHISMQTRMELYWVPASLPAHYTHHSAYCSPLCEAGIAVPLLKHVESISSRGPGMQAGLGVS